MKFYMSTMQTSRVCFLEWLTKIANELDLRKWCFTAMWEERHGSDGP